MAFAKDRDLIVYEPLLFRDVGWSSQRIGGASDVVVAGTTLTTTKMDFEAVGIEAGHVVVVDGVAIEVVARVSSSVLTVSLLREEPGGSLVAPVSTATGEMRISTFLPQVGVVHGQLMRAAGIEPSDPERIPGESDITNPAALVRAEALGALHLVFAAAAAAIGADSILWMKANMYRDRFIAERGRIAVEVDLDGDGEPDAVRRLNTMQFVRG